MATSALNGKAVDDDEQLLKTFIVHLASAQPVPIPTETLCGGITHFLSTLSEPDLGEFATTLITSQQVWSDASQARQIQNAIRISVRAKVSAIEQSVKGAYFSKSRSNRAARKWLGALLAVVETQESAIGREWVLSGLLIEIGETRDVQWRQEGVRLEEEIVMILAVPEPNIASLDIACGVIPYIGDARLRVLDLQVLLSVLRYHLGSSLASDRNLDVIATIARAISHLIPVLDGGTSADRTYLWQAIQEFCKESRISSTYAKDQGWEHDKLALFAFLLSATSVLEIILQSQPPPLPSTSDALDPASQIAIDVLHTLYTFSDIIDTSEGGFEGYQKVLLGCLDVLACKGGVAGTTQLFRRLRREVETSIAKDGFILVLGEELVHTMEASIARDILLPMAERCLSESSHRPSFEAAHAFLLELIETATRESERPTHPFLDELLPSYAQLLVQQAESGNVSVDQLRSAFSSVVKCAAMREPASFTIYLGILDRQSTASTTSLAQAVRLIRIDLAPYIPRRELRSYLEDLAAYMLETGIDTSQRLEVSAAAFKMVLQGLPDESRRTGMDWWLRWRDSLEDLGRHGSRSGIARARL